MSGKRDNAAGHLKTALVMAESFSMSRKPDNKRKSLGGNAVLERKDILKGKYG